MFRRLTSIRRLALILALGGCCEGAHAREATASKHWTSLDPSALAALYSGKTWVWKDGAAYFAPDGRFKAWSRSEGKLTEGFGTWDIRSDGGMCFTATWRTSPAKPQEAAGKPVETCFGHATRGNVLRR